MEIALRIKQNMNALSRQTSSLLSFDPEGKIEEKDPEHDRHDSDEDREEFGCRERVEEEEDAEKDGKRAVKNKNCFAWKRSFDAHDHKKLKTSDQQPPYADEDHEYFQRFLCVHHNQDA